MPRGGFVVSRFTGVKDGQGGCRQVEHKEQQMVRFLCCRSYQPQLTQRTDHFVGVQGMTSRHNEMEALVPGWVETKGMPRHGMACQSPIGKRPSEYCTKTRPIRALKKADIRCRTTTAAEQPRTRRQSTGAFDARTTTASGNLRV